MDILEIVRGWLDKQNLRYCIDRCPVEEGQWGLFPQGRRVVILREDVLGGFTCRARYQYLLKTPAIPGENTARVVEQLQLAAATAPPNLGARGRFTAHDGGLTKSAGNGLAWYEIRLDAEREEEYA